MTTRACRTVPVAIAVCGWLAATPAAAQSVTVTAANPSSGPQASQALVIKISGKNFTPGARSEFFVSGTTDPGGIVVRGTTFVSSTEVDATVDIADTATIASFDIKVTNTSGRSGKGSDLFNVVQKKTTLPPPPPLILNFDSTDTSSTPYALRGDGSPLAGYRTLADGTLEGAYLGGPFGGSSATGGAQIILSTGARALYLTLGPPAIPPPTPVPADCVPSGTWIIRQVSRFGFNVADTAGANFGLEGMGGNGVPLVLTSGGTTPGYDIPGLINFQRDGSTASYSMYFWQRLGTTVTRTSQNTWTVTHDATDPLRLTCAVPKIKGQGGGYEMGSFQVPFSLTVTCNLSPSGTCQ